MSHGLIIGPEVVAWVAKQTNEFGNYGCATGIGWLVDGQIMAGVAYNEYNGPNVNAHISTRIALPRQFLWTIFDYPFKQLKVKRLTGLVGEGNTKANNLCQRLGFVEEVRLKDAHPTGDTIVYRMLPEQCKWLGLRHE